MTGGVGCCREDGEVDRFSSGGLESVFGGVFGRTMRCGREG